MQTLQQGHCHPMDRCGTRNFKVNGQGHPRLGSPLQHPAFGASTSAGQPASQHHLQGLPNKERSVLAVGGTYDIGIYI